jgi:hypothetical protein
MREPYSPSKTARWIVGPLVLVLLLAAAWSAFWYFAALKSEEVIAAWIAREAQLGRNYDCRSRTVGGYPFRIEVNCEEPTATIRDPNVAVSIRAKNLVAVAQVYQPDLIIAEVTGPMTVVESESGVTFDADWKLLQASLRGPPERPERLSLAADGVKLVRAGGAGEPSSLLQAAHLEFHVRHAVGYSADVPVFELAVRAHDALVPTLTQWVNGPLNVDGLATLSGVSDFKVKPLPQRLREWQAANGRLLLTSLRVQQGNAVGVAKGDVGLNASGKPDGAFDITVAGFDQVLQGLLGGKGQGLQAGLMAGLSLLGPQTELEGKRAVKLPLRLQDGNVLLGPVRIAQIAPLF